MTLILSDYLKSDKVQKCSSPAGGRVCSSFFFNKALLFLTPLVYALFSLNIYNWVIYLFFSCDDQENLVLSRKFLLSAQKTFSPLFLHIGCVQFCPVEGARVRNEWINACSWKMTRFRNGTLHLLWAVPLGSMWWSLDPKWGRTCWQMQLNIH